MSAQVAPDSLVARPDDDDYSPAALKQWLINKWNRHGEIEDREAARLIVNLQILLSHERERATVAESRLERVTQAADAMRHFCADGYCDGDTHLHYSLRKLGDDANLTPEVRAVRAYDAIRAEKDS